MAHFFHVSKSPQGEASWNGFEGLPPLLIESNSTNFLGASIMYKHFEALKSGSETMSHIQGRNKGIVEREATGDWASIGKIGH